MTNTYSVGTLVQCNVTFQNTSGVNTDPSTVTATIKDPSGVETNPAVTKDGVGLYHFTFTTALPGVHYYRFNGTGTLVVAAESAFVVVPTRS